MKMLELGASGLFRVRVEVLWLFAGHIAVGIGGIIGISLLTNVMNAATFGALSLYVGMAALIMSVLVNPIIQASIRFVSAVGNEHELARVRAITLQWLVILLVVVGILSLPVGLGMSQLFGTWWFVPPLVVVLLIVDSIRAYNTSLLNAVRRQREFILWRATDAWFRPLAAVTLVSLFSSAAWLGLLGYVLGTAAVGLIFIWVGRPGELARQAVRARKRPVSSSVDVSALVRYALPMIPIGALGWVLGTGDRYIIGGMLSVEATGLYAAIYAITSRPFLALGQFFDVLLRPRLFDAGSAQHWRRFNQIFLGWIALTLAVTLPLVGVIFLFAEPLTALILGPDFADSAHLMPWIALGYVFAIAYQPVQRVLQSYLLTHYTLLIQVLTTIIGVVSIIVGVRYGGLLGAAIALPVYFGSQLAIAAVILGWSKQVRETFLRFHTSGSTEK